nr:hypothetical protein [Ferrimicrobium acidiphilum]
MNADEVTITPGKGYAKRLTPVIRKFLKMKIAEYAEQVLEAAEVVTKRNRWSVHIVWDEEAPEAAKTGSYIYWLAVDNPVRLRFMIGSFNNDEDGHSEETYVAEFRFPGLPTKRRKPAPRRHVGDPVMLLALLGAKGGRHALVAA